MGCSKEVIQHLAFRLHCKIRQFPIQDLWLPTEAILISSGRVTLYEAISFEFTVYHMPLFKMLVVVVERLNCI